MTLARIQVFQPDGTFIKSFGSHGEGDGQFDAPSGILIDLDGNLVILDSDNFRIQILDSEGKFLLKFGERGKDDGQIQDIRGAIIDHDGNIAATDPSLHKVQVFSTKGKYLRTFGQPHLQQPLGICIDADGNYFVFNEDRPNVYVFSHCGDLIREFTSQAKTPWGIAAAKEGLVVADNGQNRIVIMDYEGNLLTVFGEEGEDDGSLNWPRGVVIDSNGNILVTDNHRVQTFG